MARRTNVTMRKRQREQRKAEKAEEKRAKRLARADARGTEGADEEPEDQPGAELPMEHSAEPIGNEPAMVAWCGICKVVRDHALVEPKPKRVRCKTCGDEHPFRKTKPAARKKAKKADKKADNSYDGLIAGLDPSEASPYDTATVFDHRTLIDHPSFGLGVVARVLPDRKIEVLFPEGARVLAHGR